MYFKLFFITIITLFSQTLHAETSLSVGKVTTNQAEGNINITKGASVSLDEAYAKKHNIVIAAPISFIVPAPKQVKVLYPPETGGSYILFNFFSPDKKTPYENLQLTSLTIPEGPTEQRLAVAEKLLKEQGLPQALKGHQDAKTFGTYRTKINGNDAVGAIGQYTDPQYGNTIVKFVAILHPKTKSGVLAVANILSQNSPAVKTAEDAKTKGYGSQTIQTVRFKK